jgi:23S rRNA (adenine2503-C2)-methyltransferase
MGCGEPLLNHNHVFHSMCRIARQIPHSRFALATLIPSHSWDNFFDLTASIARKELPVKIHLSLHFPYDSLRQEWMPAALSIGPSIAALEFYKKITGQSVEIHYALIDNVNDSVRHADELASLIKGRNIPVKLLRYNERQSIDYHTSERVGFFQSILSQHGINHEYYEPPGIDVGSSCGMFLLDYYEKYNNQRPRLDTTDRQ